jgi:ParB family chromosome partitioning protein
MVLEQIRCTDIRSNERAGDDRPMAIEVLADSIRLHGVLRPLLLRPSAQGYVIVHGELRWRAARMLGLEVIPAYLVEDAERSEQVAA